MRYISGISDMVNRFMPEKVKSFTPDKKWASISGGQHHTLALDESGKLICSMARTPYVIHYEDIGPTKYDLRNFVLICLLANNPCPVYLGQIVRF